MTKVDDIVAQAVQHRIELPPDRGRNMDAAHPPLSAVLWRSGC